jgi:type IV pilus assembly protein PilB
LIRRVCSNCAEVEELPLQVLLDAGFTAEEAKTVKPMKGKGCEKCNGSGCKGRAGLYEVMEMTDDLRELILVGASSLELKKKAIEQGMITLRRSGLRKVMDGVASLEEVMRETINS